MDTQNSCDSWFLKAWNCTDSRLLIISLNRLVTVLSLSSLPSSRKPPKPDFAPNFWAKKMALDKSGIRSKPKSNICIGKSSPNLKLALLIMRLTMIS